MAFHSCGTKYHLVPCIFITFMQTYIIILSEELKASIHINVPPQKEHRNHIIQKNLWMNSDSGCGFDCLHDSEQYKLGLYSKHPWLARWDLPILKQKFSPIAIHRIQNSNSVVLSQKSADTYCSIFTRTTLHNRGQSDSLLYLMQDCHSLKGSKEIKWNRATLLKPEIQVPSSYWFSSVEGSGGQGKAGRKRREGH